MPDISVQVEGLNELLNVFEALPQEIKNRVWTTMNVILVEAIEESRANAPILDGPLRESMTGDVEIVGDNISMTVSADTPYANKLHEWDGWKLGPISSQQPMTPSGGVGAKYIERTFMFHLFEWQQRIGKTIVEGK